MTTKDFLSQYRELKAEIEGLRDELKQLEAIAEKTSPSREPCSGGGNLSDRVGRTSAKIVDLKNEISEEKRRLVELRREIVREIKAVPNPKQRLVLQYRYINGWRWEKIAAHLGFSYQWVCVLHGRGLEMISKKFFEN